VIINVCDEKIPPLRAAKRKSGIALGVKITAEKSPHVDPKRKKG